MIGLIPWLAAAFAAVFGSYRKFIFTLISLLAAQFLVKTLAAFGVGWAVYELSDWGLSSIFGEVKGYLGNLPPLVLSVMANLRFDECLQIIFSAFAVRLTLMGFQNGFLKIFQWN